MAARFLALSTHGDAVTFWSATGNGGKEAGPSDDGAQRQTGPKTAPVRTRAGSAGETTDMNQGEGAR